MFGVAVYHSNEEVSPISAVTVTSRDSLPPMA
jgi:hypothetical protein